ncbi:MAG: aminoglycoside phosphotransferase [Opitutia bacterium]|nr:aminoglycoside phosphotransferase [Opitutaceae bacterium]PHX86619.1 MAG: aminoglycoside phosphotransferase [Opitutae bacterium]
MPSDLPPSSGPEFQLPVIADAAGLAAVHTFLVARRLAAPGESLVLERPGSSNMNCVWRAHLPGRSLMLKQARPWVEKYPTIAAPVERTEAEARFYRLAARDPHLATRLPAILDHDPAAHVLVLADLAPATPLEICYPGPTGAHLDFAAIDELAATINRLHRVAVPAAEAPALRNHAMRTLNHAHLFDLPIRAEGPFDAFLESLTPGLADASRAFRSDAVYVQLVTALGRRYLEHDHPHLLHGDFFLGSLLRAPGGAIMLIDPEFSFGGEPEFDLGVFYAHLILSNHPEPVRARWLEKTAADRDDRLIRHYAGVEIMRRLIGVAQLPLPAALAPKRAWLAQSRELLAA